LLKVSSIKKRKFIFTMAGVRFK